MLKRFGKKWERSLATRETNRCRFTRFEYAPEPGGGRFSSRPTTTVSLLTSERCQYWNCRRPTGLLGVAATVANRRYASTWTVETRASDARVRVGLSWLRLNQFYAELPCNGSASSNKRINIPHGVHDSTKSVRPSCLLHPIHTFCVIRVFTPVRDEAVGVWMLIYKHKWVLQYLLIVDHVGTRSIQPTKFETLIPRPRPRSVSHSKYWPGHGFIGESGVCHLHVIDKNVNTWRPYSGTRWRKRVPVCLNNAHQ